jgi:hypothetical protein
MSPRLWAVTGDDGHALELVYVRRLGTWRERTRRGFDERVVLLLADGRIAAVTHEGILDPPRDRYSVEVFESLDAVLNALPECHRARIGEAVRQSYAWALARRVERVLERARWHAR